MGNISKIQVGGVEYDIVDQLLTTEVSKKADKSQIPTKLSQLEKDIEIGASITVDSELSETSENPVQNKVVYGGLVDLAVAVDDLGVAFDARLVLQDNAINSKADKTYVAEAIANAITNTLNTAV